MNVIWVDGKFVPEKDARVHILNHALHYGSSVFEGIRVYNTSHGPAVFRLKEHIDRLFFSASAFDIKIPYSKAQIERTILNLVAKNKFKECYVRPIAFFGENEMRLNPVKARVRLAIAAWPWGKYLGERAVLSVGISKYIRFHPDSIVPGAKIGGFYATSVLASIEARKRKFDECLLLDHEGYVAEGPGENIFIVKNGHLIAPESPSILPGITRDSVIAIARDLKIPVIKKRVSRKELFAADEVFLSGTAVEIGAIGKIEGRRVGRGAAAGKAGPLTLKIREAYNAATHGGAPKRLKWLAFVR
jgi:branched-chain amino acid aminotransferase